MNYIQHLNSFFTWVQNEKKVKPTEICLYLSLFQEWNRLYFPLSFPIDFNQLKKLCKIQSKTTFYQSLNNLEDYGLIRYKNTSHPYQKSQVTLHAFNKDQQVVRDVSEPINVTRTEQKVVNTITKNDTEDTKNCSTYNKYTNHKTLQTETSINSFNYNEPL